LGVLRGALCVAIASWRITLLEDDLTMIYRSGRVNPIAKAQATANRNRSTAHVDKNKYNRKKDKDNANKDRSNEKLENPKSGWQA